MNIITWPILLLLILLSSRSFAESFFLPTPDNDVVGQLIAVQLNSSDTLLDIARQFDVGYNEITQANPDIDPWQPDKDSFVVVPSLYILPNTPRKGIVINVPEMRLYYYPKPKKDQPPMVITYPISIGKEGWLMPLGQSKITAKIENPSWTVPPGIRAAYKAEGHDLPKVVPPGDKNPLGKFAMKLGDSGYFIHGTNKPHGIGMRVSYGCIRLYPEDIAKFIYMTPRKTPVTVINQPFKVGKHHGKVYVEAHPTLAEWDTPSLFDNLPTTLNTDDLALLVSSPEKLHQIIKQQSGIPIPLQLKNRSNLVSAPENSWFIQVGTYKNQKNVDRRLKLLKNEGLKIHTARTKKGLCSVVVGPFKEKDSAQKMNTKIKQSYRINTIILPPKSSSTLQLNHCFFIK